MSKHDIIGLILAGGRARRMGGRDKAFVELGGETLLARTIARAKPQVGELLINANDDPARFVPFGFPVVEDRIGGYLGPLAGIFAGIEWARDHRADARWVASFACDCPFFPVDLVQRLRNKAEAENAMAAIASSGGRDHPVFALWRTDIPETSESVLNEKGLRKMDGFVATLSHVRVEFPIAAIDPFFNINTPEDLAAAELLL